MNNRAEQIFFGCGFCRVLINFISRQLFYLVSIFFHLIFRVADQLVNTIFFLCLAVRAFFPQ